MQNLISINIKDEALYMRLKEGALIEGRSLSSYCSRLLVAAIAHNDAKLYNNNDIII